MTSTAVSELSNIMVTQSAGQTENKTPKESFADVFGNASDKKDLSTMNYPEKQNRSRVEETIEKFSSKKKIQKDTEDSRPLNEKQRAENVTETSDENSDKGKEINDKAEQIVEKVAEETDVTVEEVEVAMQQLGMIPTDLFQNDNLTQLTMKLSDADGNVELLTNAELYEAVQSLVDFAGQSMEELGLDAKQIQEILDAAKLETENGIAMENNLSEETVSTDEEFVATTKTDERNTLIDSELSQRTDSGQNKPFEVQGEDLLKTQYTVQNETQNDSLDQNANEESNGNNAAGQQGNNFQTQFLNEQVKFVEEIKLPQASTEEIMQQITEYIKVSVKPEMTHLEMQLTPESLGTVQVHITSKQGAVTAQFVAQNESVKVALETQAVTLRENLQEQGVKVEAIEVTVASYEFTRDMQQQNNQETPQRQAKRATTHRIDLSRMEELDELTEDEQIAVDLMTANGNTVDYTA